MNVTKIHNALQVIVNDRALRQYLRANDPMALNQALEALDAPAGPLPPVRNFETGLVVVLDDRDVAQARNVLHTGDAASTYTLLRQAGIRFNTHTVIRHGADTPFGGHRLLVQVDDTWIEVMSKSDAVMPERACTIGGPAVGVYLMPASEWNEVLVRKARNLLGSTR